MITYEPVMTASGFDYAVTNSGGMKTSGVELSVNARIINKKNFSWDAGINAAKTVPPLQNFL